MEMKRKKTPMFTSSRMMLEGSFGVFMAVFIFCVVLTIFTDGFLTTDSIFSTSRTFSLSTIVGFSQMMALTVGHMNLSAGAIGGLAGATVGWLFQGFGALNWAVIPAGILVGTPCGAFNGLSTVLVRTLSGTIGVHGPYPAITAISTRSEDTSSKED